MFKSTAARETSIEKKVWAGKHSTGREETDVERSQAQRCRKRRRGEGGRCLEIKRDVEKKKTDEQLK